MRRSCVIALLAGMCAAVAGAQEATPQQEAVLKLRENWYRVELLVFARRDSTALAAERWDPMPELAYPEGYRFLIDRELADRRLQDFAAFASSFDTNGRQELILPFTVEGVESLARPDAILKAPEPDRPDFLLEESTGTNETASSDTGTVNAADLATQGDDGSDVGAEPQEDPDPDADPNAPLLALPFVLLDESALEFRAQSRQLSARGSEVLFHKAWWAPLTDEQESVTIALDRGGDRAHIDWPALQGAIRIYRSRYLHADIDLWLNTDGPYLPPEWVMPAPPLPDPSLVGAHQDGSDADLSADARTVDDLLPRTEARSAYDTGFFARFELPPATADTAGINADNRPRDPDTGLEEATEGSPDTSAREPEYPFRHAIVHRQSRRMRGGEIHYLDHPVIGVILRLTPVDVDNLPVTSPEESVWRERHGFPAERVPAMPDAGEADRENLSLR